MSESKWNCAPGQGQSGESINVIKSDNLDKCQEKCIEFNGCIGIDYTNEGKKIDKSCRMYKLNTVRSDPGDDHRTYCSLLAIGTNVYDLK